MATTAPRALTKGLRLGGEPGGASHAPHAHGNEDTHADGYADTDAHQHTNTNAYCGSATEPADE